MTRSRLPRPLLRLAVLCTAAGIAGAGVTAFGADVDSSLRIAPPSAWVDQVPGESLEPPSKDAGGSVEFLLLDRQENTARQEYYQREVGQIVTAAGAQEGSTLSVVYDPSFQTLTLHHVRVLRAGKVTSRLSRQAVHLLRRETSLESQMLDGSFTASMLLEDVRPGDRIDWAYTVKGRNPVFEGVFSDEFTLGWAVPVRRVRVRILCPPSLELRWRVLGGSSEPRVRADGEEIEYTWQLQDVPAVAPEDRTPPWHVAAPWLQVTEYRDWGELASWAASLYSPSTLPAELQRLADGWMRQHALPADRAQAALEWVQQNIRFVGIELGAGSHRPRSPATVAAKRFGDCKDKSYLLCTLLGRMGITAEPVLVNTWSCKLVADMLPLPSAFNHVVTRLRIGDRDILVDPTLAFQRGSLAQRAMPDYGYGLVAAAGSRDLFAFGGVRGGTPRIEVVTRMKAHGRDEPADFEVDTVYTGGAADDIRAYLAARRLEDVGRDYLNYYATRYPGIEAAALPRVEDDAGRNAFRVIESYRLPGFWVAQTGVEAHTASVYADAIIEALPRSQTKVRRTPLLVRHPFEVSQRMEVELPEEWPGSPENATFTNPAFELSVERRHGGTSFTLRWDYRSLAAEVSAADAQKVQRAILDLDPELGYSLTWGKPPARNPDAGLPATIPLAVALVAAAALVAAGILVSRRIRHAPGSAPQAVLEAGLAGPEGLRGWLVLVALGLFPAPVVSISTLVQLLPSLSRAGWKELVFAGSGLRGVVQAARTLFDLVTNLASIAACILLLVLFFRRRRAFKPGYIIMVATGAAVNVIQIAAGWLTLREAAASTAVLQVVVAALQAVVWILYMRRSRRVARTFVR
jgi:transglutaminase-like putative cysteine protease